MKPTVVTRIVQLYQQEKSLLASGQFGQGLWPLNPLLGQFLSSLIRLQGLQYGLEVGVGVGFSTLWLGTAFRENRGKLLSLEYFPPKVEQLERHLRHVMGVEYEQTVSVVPSEYSRVLRHIRPKTLDFVFFDQRKGDYLAHLQALLPKLKKGAFICADNVLSHGDACQDYLKVVRTDPRFASVCLSYGDGVEVTRFLS